jgi:copper homeostasis protein
MAPGTPKRFLLEIAVASVEDALAAETGGADRLELSAALALGGVTPSLGTLIEVRKVVRLPVMVLIRPRPGGFAYSATEFAVMQRDADLALAHGADGIVFGVLNGDGTVDLPRCRQLRRQAAGRVTVFHRAFDVTADPLLSLDRLVDVGIHRILTSGQERTAALGVPLIAGLVGRATRRIEILPAGGINGHNAADLLARTGCDQVHASLRVERTDRSGNAPARVCFNSPASLPEGHYQATDPVAVAELRRALADGESQGD